MTLSLFLLFLVWSWMLKWLKIQTIWILIFSGIASDCNRTWIQFHKMMLFGRKISGVTKNPECFKYKTDGIGKYRQSPLNICVQSINQKKRNVCGKTPNPALFSVFLIMFVKSETTMCYHMEILREICTKNVHNLTTADNESDNQSNTSYKQSFILLIIVCWFKQNLYNSISNNITSSNSYNSINYRMNLSKTA